MFAFSATLSSSLARRSLGEGGRLPRRGLESRCRSCYRWLSPMKKSTQILVLILFALIGTLGTQVYVGFVHRAGTRLVEIGFGDALRQLQESPPGPQRVETFVARLKAINTDHAPAEVKQTLQNYIAVVEQLLDALRAGRDITPYDRAIAEATQRLGDSVREYD